jgi:hypothetical protein
LTNNRANSINWVLWFGIAFDERFVFNSWSVSIFNQTWALYQSWVINCSWALKTFYDYRKKIIMCELEKSFNFEIWKKLWFTLSGITNPSIIARYPVELVLKTTSNDEFFWWDTIIKDATDFSSASILWIYIQNSSKVIAEFNKPINIMQDPWFTLNINGLQTNWSYTTDDTNTKLFINTSEQVSGTNYTLTLSWVKTFNNIYTTWALIQNFIWFDPSVKRLDYVSPYNISRGTYNNLVYIYWSNNIFDGSVTNVNLWAWIFLSWSVMKDPNDLNQIKFYVNIASWTFLWNRDVTVNMNSGTIYKLFNGISINKNWW